MEVVLGSLRQGHWETRGRRVSQETLHSLIRALLVYNRDHQISLPLHAPGYI